MAQLEAQLRVETKIENLTFVQQPVSNGIYICIKHLIDKIIPKEKCA